MAVREKVDIVCLVLLAVLKIVNSDVRAVDVTHSIKLNK